MLETILEFALVLALAGFFVMWAKWEEQKLKTKEERENHKAALSLHNAAVNDLERSMERERCMEDEIRRLGVWNRIAQREKDEMQDKLSALLCPRNDHVWKNGVCVKCGRVQE